MFASARFHSHSDFVDLTMYQFGQSKCKPESMPGYAVYAHYLFHYIFAGKGILYMKDKEGHIHSYPLQAGDGFLIAPGVQCNYVADIIDPWHYAWVEFDGLRARKVISKTKFATEPALTISSQYAQNITDNMLFIIDNPQHPPLQLVAHLYLFVNALSLAAREDRPVFEDGVQDFYIQEAIDFISRNYQKELTIRDIAQHLSIHRSYLSRIFKGALGITPLEFLIRHRIDMACQLLKDTSSSVGHISALVGYPNSLNFSRAFKRETGQSPTEFRKQI